MNLFGKKKQATSGPTPVQTPLDTIKTLRDNLATLEKREEHIQKKIEASVLEAKQKMAKNDKNGALFALKRKKMYEGEVSKLQGARITLDSQILALESAAVNMETFKAMKSGAAAMKQLHGSIDADKVDDIMDEIQEQKDIHDAISEAISRPGQDMFDDQELLDELAELDALSVETETVAAAPAPAAATTVFNFPTVPSAAPSKPAMVEETDDERALRELEASMNAF